MLIPAGGTAADAFEYTGGDVELDQMVVTFKLLPGLLWSDGTPLTAADSVYSFNLNANPDSGGTKFTTDRTASYEASDDVIAVWTGLPGYKDQEYFINFWQPLPEHQLGQYTALELMEAEESTRLPLGYGPYIIEDWEQGDSITLSKNPNYFRADEGLPVFDFVVTRFVGKDSNANIAALLSGECDILAQLTGLDDEIERVLELNSSGKINATFTTGTSWGHVDFSIQHSDYDDGYQLGSDRSDFFSDVRTRRAFAMCMDRQAVIDEIFFGQSILINTYIPPQHPLYNPEVIQFEFDVPNGSDLLEEVGWQDHDNDPATPRIAENVENVVNDTELIVEFAGPEGGLGPQVIAILQESLAKCGIRADVQLYPADEFFGDGPEGVIFGRNYDLTVFSWLTGVAPPCDLYLGSQTTGPAGETFISIMTGDEVNYGSWGSNNNTGFFDPEYETVCNAAVQNLPGQPGYEEAKKPTWRRSASSLNSFR
jgi:peptide/nickel transport system substrate-binding protein